MLAIDQKLGNLRMVSCNHSETGRHFDHDSVGTVPMNLIL